MTIASELGRFVTGHPASDLPPQAIDHARMLIASTLASAAPGSTLQSSKIIRALEAERGGAAQATAWWGAAERLPVAGAARVNAVMSDAAASDDSDLRNIAHLGTPACAVALAVAEHTGARGADVLAAIVLGYELGGRIGTALQSGHKRKGFHSSIIAVFTAVGVAARLLGLSAEQASHAIALTATSIGGLGAAAQTSTAREYHAGNVATAGVQAAQAAARGFTAEEAILETRYGFFEAFGLEADAQAAVRELGRSWSILDHMAIKLMPGGHPHHAVAEAAAKAARAGDVKPEQIAAIEISRPGFQAFASPKLPTDLIEMAHSVEFFAAAGAVDRDFSWVHATEAKITDERIRAALGKVRMVPPPTLELERYLSGCTVTIRTTDGASHASTVYAPHGAATLGIPWADVEAKYRALVPAAGLAPRRIEDSLALIRGFERTAHVRELLDLLRL